MNSVRFPATDANRIVAARSSVAAGGKGVVPSRPLAAGRWGALLLAALGLVPGVAVAANTNLTYKAELTVRETFDSNVYLQDVSPLAHRESFVTSVMPKIGLEYRICPAFKVSPFYSPEVVRFHAEPSEDYVAHRGGLILGGNVQEVTWEQQSSVTWIDGSKLGLSFTGPGGAPAIGGIPIRDRRAAVVYRNSFRAFHPIGDWFFRPMALSYVHDFRTEQRDPAIDPVYQNYVDRNDITGGLDVGFKSFKDAYLVAGYRYGQQEEPPLPGRTTHYSNVYHRFLVGFEGTITGWLKGAIAIGPDYRDFARHTPANFDDHHTKLFIDASAAVTLTKQDTIAVIVKQYEQPAFGTPSVYEDITYEASWKHQCDDRFTAAAGFRAYGGDWLSPVSREDWIYTPSVMMSYVFTKQLSGELSYSYDWVESKVPNTEGREFTRNLVMLGMKYAF
ncbi:MAG: outer membrane beta-barrel protein [Verrucomicrobiota bacterium]